jgi:hypothetical protein
MSRRESGRTATGHGGHSEKRLWDVTSGEKLLPLKAPIGFILSATVTPDGQQVVTGGWGGTIQFWDISNGQELRKLSAINRGVASVALAAHGQRLVAGCGDGTATVWDTASGWELFTLKGHTDFITSITVTPDEQRIVTGSVDGTARLWDSISGRELLTLKGDTGPVRSVAVTPDGRWIVAGTEDGTVKIWEAASPADVARWAQQDQKVERQWAAWQWPGPKARGFIQDWLVLGPLALAAGQRGAKGLEHQQIPGEASLHPRAGDHVVVDGQEFTWREHHDEVPSLDLNGFLGQECNHCVAYVVCYVRSTAERHDLLLQVICGEQAKVYLNGQQVYQYTRGDTRVPEPIGPVLLHNGMNVLVLKVLKKKWWGGWQACARFVDREGNPVQGLQVRLSPDTSP